MPSSTKAILSAWRTVEIRWGNFGGIWCFSPGPAPSSSAVGLFVVEHGARDVTSSKRRIGASLMIARAMLSLCAWPPKIESQSFSDSWP